MRGFLRVLVLGTLVLILFAIGFNALQPSAPGAAPERIALTPAQIPDDLRECMATYAGQYWAEGPMASHPSAVRRQTLVLRRDWSVTLTTAYPGSRHPQSVENGTWRCDGKRASVVLNAAREQPERNAITFELRDRELVSTRSDASRYPEGLKLRRQ